MKNFSRRKFLATSGSALTTGLLVQGCDSIKQFFPDKHNSNPVFPVIHTTDLYHVHCDPDDHWDLASIYALAYSGLIDLKGIVIDFPVKPSLGDPDVMGIAQMNYYTGLIIPSVVGSPYLMKNRNDTIPDATKIELQGVHWIIGTLKNSSAAVVIHVVGTATNVAVALKKEPELFNKKCAAIYLNAGSGYLGKGNNVEYNVSLDPSSFAAVFDAPCPVYWLPCVNVSEVAEVGEFGTYYKFFQKDILPFLPEKLKNFFTFMYGRKQNNQWFTYLNGPPEEELLTLHSNRYRNMWCTAGFLHTAGKKVTTNGEIVALESEKESVFSFKPVSVTCDEQGFTSWEIKKQSRDRFIFHMDDMANYQSAMTLALKNMLIQLPE
jgi:hypothetical protein